MDVARLLIGVAFDGRSESDVLVAAVSDLYGDSVEPSQSPRPPAGLGSFDEFFSEHARRLPAHVEEAIRRIEEEIEQ